MPANDFKALATAAGANVLTQAQYEALANTLIANGFQSGVVPSDAFNKVLRQASFVAAALAQFTADNQAADVLDDGNLAGFAAKFLAALNGSAGVTPAQFDNSTKRATTAFVQRALGNLSGFIDIAGDGSVAVGDAGKAVFLTGAVAQTVTLPPVAAVVPGAAFHFYNGTNFNKTIQANASEQIINPVSQGNTFTLRNSETLTLVMRNGAWYAIGGTAVSRFTGGFNASHAANGFQRLPSGLIEQWGTFSASVGSTSPSSQVVNFPIQFPNNCYGVVGTFASGIGEGHLSYTCEGANVSSFTLRAIKGSGGVTALSFRYRCLGG